MAKVHEIWLGIKAKLDNAVPKAFDDVTKLTNKTKAAVEKFSKVDPFAKLNPQDFLKQQGNVKNKLDNLTATLSKNQSKTDKLRNEYDKAQQTCKKLANEISNSAASTAKQESAFKRAISNSDKLKREWRDGTSKAKELRKEIQELQNQQSRMNGVNTYQKIKQRLTARAEQNKSSGSESMVKAATAIYTAKAAAQSVSFLAEPIKQAMKFESVMADIRKLVHFDTPQEFAEMGEQLKKLSLRVPMAVDGLAHIAAAAAQAGIAKKDILEFTENAAQMGVAYNITAEQAGDMMAKWRSAFDMNQKQVMQLADQVNILSDNSAATGVEIGEVVTRIGALGKIAGVTQSQLSALAATSIGGGFKSDQAATGIKKLFTVLKSGDAITKSQGEALDKLGINVVQLSKDIQNKGAPAILDVLRKIKKLDEYKQVSALKSIFGEEAVGPIAALANNIDQVEKNLTLVGEEANYAGSMLREFNARSATTENTMQLFKNSISAVAITVGNTFLPSLNQMMTDINKTLNDSIMPFVQAHLESIKTLGQVALALAGVVAAVAITKSVFFALAGVWSFANGALMLLGKTLLWFIPQQWRVVVATKAMNVVQSISNFLMNANPMIRVVTGIVALVGALIWVCTHWKEFCSWVSNAWEKVKTLFGWVIKVKDAIASLFDGNDGTHKLDIDYELKNKTRFAGDMNSVNQTQQARMSQGSGTMTYNASPVVNVYGGDPKTITDAVDNGMSKSQEKLSNNFWPTNRNSYGYGNT